MLKNIDKEKCARYRWPIYTKVCPDCYQEVHIKKVSTRGRTTGSWICNECSFKYTRQGPDIKEQDRYYIGNVNEYGQVFGNKVREVCKDTSLELRELVKLLYYAGVSVGGLEATKEAYVVAINAIDHSLAQGYDSYSIQGIDTEQRNV